MRETEDSTGGSCQGLGDGWRKSSYSIGDCFALAEHANGIGLKSTNRPDDGSLSLSREQVSAWFDHIKSGQFDLRT